ncbi:MAG: serine/threonine protein kinase [Planctomycetes bacterium]|nr:serine/threonine protein kinase [Planctomycetota bacterium]
MLGSPKALLRFEREVELAARLEHPHIARVYESGLRQGVYYYAMELVEGVPLDQYVADHALSQRQVLPLMRTVCEAVQHAHQRGVIHRDLKPSNILVTPDGQPHVLDFGLAKTLLEDDAQVAVSVDGEAAGTPAYMSPEQAAAKLNLIDTRTDVYSLGVILYRLLTKEFPHDLTGTRLEVLRRIAEEEVRRPRQFAKVVDKELEALLLKALAHDPEGRYPTAHALAEDLRRYAAYEPIEARPMGSFGRMRRWCKRKPLIAGLVAAVVVALVAGTGISTYFGIVAQRRAAEETVQRLEAERQTRLAKEAADLAMGVTEFLGSAPELLVNPELAKMMRSHVLSMQKMDVGKRHPEIIRSLLNIANSLVALSQCPDDEEMQRGKLYYRQQALGKEHPATLACMLDLAAVLAWQGKYAEAEDMARQLLEIRQRVLGKDHTDTRLCMHNLAYVLDAQGKKDEAAALRKQAEDLRGQASEKESGGKPVEQTAPSQGK